MKRTILLFAVAAMLAACTHETEMFQTITIRIGNVESGLMTKASASDLLAQTMPTEMPTLKLTSTTNPNRQYSIQAGQSANVALDSYTIRGEYKPSSVWKCWRGECYTQPRYSIYGSIDVDGSQDSYTIPAAWQCFALIWDKATTDRLTMWDASPAPAECPIWVGDEDKAIIYIHDGGWTATTYLIVTAYPTDDVNYEATTYNLSRTSASDVMQVQYGRWYILHPGAVQTSSGSFGIDLPEWQQGN